MVIERDTIMLQISEFARGSDISWSAIRFVWAAKSLSTRDTYL